MSYKLRFVQRFQESKRAEFLELEKQFAVLERTVCEFPKGKRYLPYSGREAANTLIWECEFETLEDAQKALAFLENDPRHEALYKQQSVYFIESYVEILKELGVE
jgi:hypothetical protein